MDASSSSWPFGWDKDRVKTELQKIAEYGKSHTNGVCWRSWENHLVYCMSFDSQYVDVQCARSLLGLYFAIEGDLKDAIRVDLEV